MKTQYHAGEDCGSGRTGLEDYGSGRAGREASVPAHPSYVEPALASGTIALMERGYPPPPVARKILKTQANCRKILGLGQLRAKS